jgi:prepilin-type N-terminal cleavage/methylation domain-containing protein/prepilin-type processing-associated H-X9-DG protein
MFAIRKHRQRRAMTLVELLVVLAILGVLIGLLLPAVQKVRESASRIQCQNSLRQLALAAHNYHDSLGSLPIGLVAVNASAGRFAGGTNLWVEMLPFLEQDNLNHRWDYRDYRNNLAGGRDATAAQVIKVLLCPSDFLPDPVHQLQQTEPFTWLNGFWALSSYGGNGGTYSFNGADTPESKDGVFFTRSRVRLTEITDGTSTTFLFGERYHLDPEYDRLTLAHDPNFSPLASWGFWASAHQAEASPGDVFLGAAVPINYRVPSASVDDSDWVVAEESRLCAFGSGHGHGANFAFVDGSVRFVSESIPLPQLQALSTRARGEVVSDP